MIKKIFAGLLFTMALMDSLIASQDPSSFDFPEAEARRDPSQEETVILDGPLRFTHNDFCICFTCRDENSFSARLEKELKLHCQLWNCFVAPSYLQHDFLTGLANQELDAQRPQIQCSHDQVARVRSGGFFKELFIRDFGIIERFLSNLALSEQDVLFLWPKVRWIEVASPVKGQETVAGRGETEECLIPVISDEVWFHIFSYLDIQSLNRLSETCILFGDREKTVGLVSRQRLNRMGRMRAKILEDYHLPTPCMETRLAHSFNPLALLVARVKAKAMGLDLDNKLQEAAEMVAQLGFQIKGTKEFQCDCPHGGCSLKVHWVCYGRAWQFFAEKLGVLRFKPRVEEPVDHDAMPAQPQIVIVMEGHAAMLPMEMMLPLLMAMGNRQGQPHEQGLPALFEQMRLREAANAPIVMPAEPFDPVQPQVERTSTSDDEDEEETKEIPRRRMDDID